MMELRVIMKDFRFGKFRQIPPSCQNSSYLASFQMDKRMVCAVILRHCHLSIGNNARFGIILSNFKY